MCCRLPACLPSSLLLVRKAGLGAGLLLAGLAATDAHGADPVIHFNRDIRPILSENCFHCHGFDSAKREAELRLDVREDAIYALAIVPGKPEESLLIERIFSEDSDERMPPVDSHRTLTDAQKDLLKRWIAAGAAYEPHWAYVPPERPLVPTVPGPGATSHPVDAFIRERLAREGLRPAPEADRRTLIRRLSFDLTGLPPAARDVEAFVASRDPQAYEKLVDQYLASPHFGERMAIPWLDLVRFADTVGFHADDPVQVWPYRDYVIDAFNRNLPFDHFTREQLAGDLLPNATAWQRVASGYNRLHRISAEGGIQDKEYLAKYNADRVRTTATVWMGATLACAECHDHKFDPFTLKDFYRFGAIFADLDEKGAYNLFGGFTPENLSVETVFASPEQAQHVSELERELARLAREFEAIDDDALAAERTAWEAEIRALADEGKLAWIPQPPLAASSPHGTTLTIEADLSVSSSGPNPINDTYRVTIPAPLRGITAVRLEAVNDPKYPGDELARAGSGFAISELTLRASADGRRAEWPLRVASARTSAPVERGHPAEAALDGDPTTALKFVRRRAPAIALHLAEPFDGGPEARLTLEIRHSDEFPFQNLGRFRVSLHTLPAPEAHPDLVPPSILRTVTIAADERTEAQTTELNKYYREIAPGLAALRERQAARQHERAAIVRRLPSLPVSKSVAPREMRVLPRGNWMDDSGEVVTPGVPEFMRQIVPADGQRVSRLDFAEWLVAPDNPLTARTFVNRLWRMYFGTGLSRTLEDLGSQGEWPTHPELLDWLAVEFRESGWNVKHLVRLLVTSATYRQSAQPTPEALERDPLNRLLARQSRFRLEAELVRDNALAVSGLLVRRIGGPSAKPYQPAGYYSALNFPKREYVPDVGEGLWRRGVYTHWQRTFLHPSLMAFDAPGRDECTANRETSNTPLQALVLLNDPSYVEAARALATRVLREGGWTANRRVRWALREVLGRPADAAEVALLRELWERQRTRYRTDPAAAQELIAIGDSPVPADLNPADLAAWTAVARAILNLHETITRP